MMRMHISRQNFHLKYLLRYVKIMKLFIYDDWKYLKVRKYLKVSWVT